MSQNDSSHGLMDFLRVLNTSGIDVDVSGDALQDSLRMVTPSRPSSSSSAFLTPSNTHTFTISHINIRSMRANFMQLVTVFQTYNYWPDLIVLSETWLFTSEVDLFSIPGYCSLANSNDSYRSGGIIVFYKENIKVQQLKVSFHTSDVLKILVTVSPSVILTVYCVYRRHASSISDFNKEIISNFRSSKCNNLLFIGDININLLDDNNADTLEYDQIMNANGLKCFIKEPTRITPRSSTCLDHIFFRTLNLKTEAEIYDLQITDHCMVSLKICAKSTKTNHSRAPIRKDLDESKFLEIVNQANFAQIFREPDVNQAYSLYIDCLQSALSAAMTPKKPSKNKVIGKPWQSAQLRGLIKEKYALIKKKARLDLRDNEKARLSVLSKTIKRQINTELKQYYEKLFLETSGDSKKQWSIINGLLNKKSQNKPIELLIDGNCISNPEHVADQLNKHYHNAPLLLKQRMQPPPADHPLHAAFLSARVPNSFFIDPVTEPEVFNCIMGLKNTKSTGSDEIKVHCLKLVASAVSGPLAHIINLSFSSGLFPDRLKVAHVVPILKKKLPAELPNSYRPISLLNSTAKIFEKLMISRLTNFLNQNSWLSEFQYGFQKGKSTEMALHRFSKIIFDGLNESKKSAAVLLDCSKAFDCVDHSMLLDVLERAGVRGVCLKWFESYLSNRTQHVRLNTAGLAGSASSDGNAAVSAVVSSPQTLHCSVPQGSNLGPLLFIIFINSLCNYKFHGSPVAFADDFCLVYAQDSWDEVSRCMNEDLVKVCFWFNSHGLSLNVSKTSIVNFKLKRDSTENIDVRCHDVTCDLGAPSCSCEPLQESKSAEYLGIIFDSNMKWTSHIARVNRIGRSFLRIFFHLRNVCPVSTLKILYHSLFESKLSYGISVWGGAYNSHIQPLFVTQKYIMRTMAREPRLNPSFPIFRKFSILPLRHLFIYKALPLFFQRCGQRNQPIRLTRQQPQYMVPRAHKEIFQKCFSFLAPRLANSVPIEIVEFANRPCFKAKIKLWLLSGFDVRSFF